MHPLTLGERERLAHETTQALPQRVVPALNAVGLARLLAAGTMVQGRHYILVCLPEVGVDQAVAPIRGGYALPESAAGLLAAVANGIGQNLTGSAAKRDPDPLFVGFHPNKGPEFIQLQSVTELGGSQGCLQGRQVVGFFLAR